MPGDHFGDWVFHLQAGVHFHEEERAVYVVQELDGAGAHVVNGLRGFHGGLAHGFTGVLAQPRCGRFFQYFLMATLHRAVPLGQVDAVALLVAEHLDFHVAWLGQVALDQHVRVAEGVPGFPLGGGQGVIEVGHCFHHPHAFTTTTGNGLQQQREAAFFGLGPQQLRRLVFAVVARHQRHTGFFHNRLGGGLGAHGGDGRRGRADEHNTVGFAGFGKAGVFRQEAVAWVNGPGTALPGNVDNGVGFQVAFGAGGRANVEGLVCHGYVPGVGVGV